MPDDNFIDTHFMSLPHTGVDDSVEEDAHAYRHAGFSFP